MNMYDLSIEELEELAIRYNFELTDELVGLVSDVIVMVLNSENKEEK
jgi:hypothetical protein